MYIVRILDIYVPSVIPQNYINVGITYTGDVVSVSQRIYLKIR